MENLAPAASAVVDLQGNTRARNTTASDSAIGVHWGRRVKWRLFRKFNDLLFAGYLAAITRSELSAGAALFVPTAPPLAALTVHNCRITWLGFVHRLALCYDG